jgi:hypothetical protein
MLRLLTVGAFACCAGCNGMTSSSPQSASGDASMNQQGNAGDAGAQVGDASMFGSEECAMQPDGSCPSGCMPVLGSVIQTARDCSDWSRPIVCTSALGGGGSSACYASDSRSEVVWVGGVDLEEPYFRGWRRCTADEDSVAQSARNRQCAALDSGNDG